MNLNVVDVTDRQAWDAALLALPQPHVLQSWAWGETKAQTGWHARAAAVAAGRAAGRCRGLLIRRLNARLPVAVAYVPKGPILDWSDAALVEAVLDRIETEARRAARSSSRSIPTSAPTPPRGGGDRGADPPRLAAFRRKYPVPEHRGQRSDAVRGRIAGRHETQVALQHPPGRAQRGGRAGWDGR